MKNTNYERVLLFIAIVVTILWCISTIIQAVFPNHPAPDSVNQIMIIVATSFFAGSLASNIRKKNGNGNGSGKDE